MPIAKGIVQQLPARFAQGHFGIGQQTGIEFIRQQRKIDVLTDEHRRRYEDATQHLARIAKGAATLVIPPDPDAPVDPDAPEPAGPRPIVAEGPPRLFSREQMRDF